MARIGNTCLLIRNLIALAALLMTTGNTAGQTYIKGNAMSTLLGLPHIGIEKGVGEFSTVQFDIMGSPWKSIQGKPIQFVLAIVEYRHHFSSKHNGFYFGGHVGGTAYTAIVQLTLKNLKLGYVYETSTTNGIADAGQTNEISLQYRFN